jgi:peptide subunit release factor RF-3
MAERNQELWRPCRARGWPVAVVVDSRGREREAVISLLDEVQMRGVLLSAHTTGVAVNFRGRLVDRCDGLTSMFRGIATHSNEGWLCLFQKGRRLR